MAINSNWFACKLNGVPFYGMETNLPELGRKTAVFEYPNTDSRYVEDMGKVRGIYEITARIESNKLTPTSYKRNKKKFEEALAKEGLSVLIHPTRGRKEVVIVRPQGQEPIQGQIGFAIYKFLALESDKNKFPTKLDDKKGFLNKLFDSLSDENKKLLQDLSKLAEDSLEAYNSVRDGVTAFTDGARQAMETINGINDEIAGVIADITDLKNTINDVINFPAKFADAFMKNINRLIEVTTNFDDCFKIQENIFNKMSLPVNNTLPETQVGNVISNVVRSSLVSNSYQVATAIDYVEQSQVSNIIKRIEAMYNSIDQNLIDDNTYSILERMRAETLLTLNNLKLKLPSITTIQTNSLPAIALAYNYYSDFAPAEYENILNLNKIQDPQNVNGNIKLFTL